MSINTIEDLKAIAYKRWNELDDIDHKYLNEAGLAAKEAFKCIIWHLAFHDTLESLTSDEEFINLVNIPDKNPEYYKIIRMMNRALNIG